jgi:hypothetical protein
MAGMPDNPIAAAIGQNNFDLLIAGGVNPAVGLCVPDSCSHHELKASNVNYLLICRLSTIFEEEKNK